jgi:hypothetical protein
MAGFYIGATEQNLLKLFEQIINDSSLNVPVLVEPQVSNYSIIY